MGTDTLTGTARSKALAIFNPWWAAIGVVIGLAIQLVGGVFGYDILSGFTGYLVMGFAVGLLSDGYTVAEAGVAAFIISAVDYAINHFLHLVLGFGIILSFAYGVIGLGIALCGAKLGEYTQSRLTL